MSQETTNNQETKKDSGESELCTPSDVPSQVSVYDNRVSVNSFLIDLNSVLAKHNVSIITNRDNDEFFFVVDKEVTSYPANTLLKSTLGVKENLYTWCDFLN